MDEVVLWRSGRAQRLGEERSAAVMEWLERVRRRRLDRLKLAVMPHDVDRLRGGGLALDLRFAEPRLFPGTDLSPQVERLLVPLGPGVEQEFGEGAVVLFWGLDGCIGSGPFFLVDPELLREARQLLD
ncbi:MAG TPA: hypothetical protein VK399_07650 [Longimicrobiaceae bacterium]|nr:hypothetical protein [Longimicrobiaceae bacterium]